MSIVRSDRGQRCGWKGMDQGRVAPRPSATTFALALVCRYSAGMFGTISSVARLVSMSAVCQDHYDDSTTTNLTRTHMRSELALPHLSTARYRSFHTSSHAFEGNGTEKRVRTRVTQLWLSRLVRPSGVGIIEEGSSSSGGYRLGQFGQTTS